MSQFRMIKDYKDNEHIRASFNRLAKETFGIDFESWYARGFWNDRYICYSMLDGDRVIANISMSKLSICIEGKTYEAIQIGTVMTHPDYRKQGLARQLMEAIYRDYDERCDFYYLFGNDFAYDFYRKLGFSPSQEHTFTMAYHNHEKPSGGMRQLHINQPEDLALIMRLTKNKAYIDKSFGIKDEQALLLFYMLYVYTDDIFYLEDKDTIVMYKIEDGVLVLIDVISENQVPVDSLLPYIATEDVKQVEFMFTPNIDTTSMVVKALEKEDSTTMFRHLDHTFKKPFRFSACSHA